MILGFLRRSSLREHMQRLGRFNRSPLRPTGMPTREDPLFSNLRRSIPIALEQEKKHNAWISKATWRLFDKKSLRAPVDRAGPAIPVEPWETYSRDPTRVLMPKLRDGQDGHKFPPHIQPSSGEIVVVTR